MLESSRSNPHCNVIEPWASPTLVVVMHHPAEILSVCLSALTLAFHDYTMALAHRISILKQ
jgi:hypothetical protein